MGHQVAGAPVAEDDPSPPSYGARRSIREQDISRERISGGFRESDPLAHLAAAVVVNRISVKDARRVPARTLRHQEHATSVVVYCSGGASLRSAARLAELSPERGCAWRLTRTRAQRQRPTTHGSGIEPASGLGSPAATAPTRHAQTGKPKRSSRRCSASGPTASPIPPAAIEHERYPASSAGTTDDAPTAH